MKGDKGDRSENGDRGLTGTIRTSVNNLISSNTTNVIGLRQDVNDNFTAIAKNKTDIATNLNSINSLNTTKTQNTTNISFNLTKITQNDADIANNNSAISANTTKITKNTNDIAAVKILAKLVPTLTLSKGVKKGRKERKAGDTSTHGNNVLTSVIVPKTGKFWVSFRVIIQPNGMTVSGFKSST